MFDVGPFQKPRLSASNLVPREAESYLRQGAIVIDKSAAERALRGVVLGRTNFLFVGADSGGERMAAMYSLVGTARLNGMDPEAYLRHVLGCITKHPINRINDLLSWNVDGDLPSFIANA